MDDLEQQLREEAADWKVGSVVLEAADTLQRYRGALEAIKRFSVDMDAVKSATAALEGRDSA